jgi:hypothetical protein
MKTCPTCNSQVAVVIVNVQNGQHFCHHCAHEVCPTFLPHFVLTLEDVLLLQAMGIDPEVSRIEAVVRKDKDGTH